MTREQAVREEIARLFGEHRRAYGPGSDKVREWDLGAADRVLAVLGERGEPVAWALMGANGIVRRVVFNRKEVELALGRQPQWRPVSVVPLYAHPPTAKDPEEPARAEETT